MLPGTFASDDDHDCSAGLGRSQARAPSGFKPGDEPLDEALGFCFGDVSPVFAQNSIPNHRQLILVTISQFASNASRRFEGGRGGAGGAICEEHLAFFGELLRLRGGFELG